MTSAPTPGETVVFGPAASGPASAPMSPAAAGATGPAATVGPVVHPIGLRGAAWMQDTPPRPPTRSERIRSYAAGLAARPRVAAARRHLTARGWRSPGGLLAAAALMATGFLGGSMLGHDEHHGGFPGDRMGTAFMHGHGMNRDGMDRDGDGH